MKTFGIIFLFLAFTGCCFLYASYADMSLMRFIYLQKSNSQNTFFNIIEKYTFLVSGIIIVVAFFAFQLRKHYQYKTFFFNILLSEFILIVIVYLAKYLINRPRPYVIYDFINNPFLTERDNSFPSLHAGIAFTVMYTFIFCNVKWYYNLLLFIWGCCIAYSSVALGKHYVSDVLGAVVFANFSAISAFYLTKSKIINYNK